MSLFLDKVNGKVSMIRVVFFAYALIVLVVWVWVSLKTHTIQDLPDSITAIIATLVVGKSVQSFAERERR